MVNQQLVDYINQNKDKFKIEDLKKTLIESGYDPKEVDEAIKIATGKMPPPPPQPSESIPSQVTFQKGTLDPHTAKLLAAVSYLIWIVAIALIFLTKKEDKFARYHGYQALFFGLTLVGISILLNVIRVIIGHISLLAIIYDILVFFIGTLFWLAVLILEIIYALKAYKGQYFTIPFVTNLVKKYVEV